MNPNRRFRELADGRVYYPNTGRAAIPPPEGYRVTSEKNVYAPILPFCPNKVKGTRKLTCCNRVVDAIICTTLETPVTFKICMSCPVANEQ